MASFGFPFSMEIVRHDIHKVDIPRGENTGEGAEIGKSDLLGHSSYVVTTLDSFRASGDGRSQEQAWQLFLSGLGLEGFAQFLAKQGKKQDR